ncbi:MAG: acetate uptake transporter [Promethearchaeota archaeon]
MNNELANPAPLGLMGFGMTTVLLNLHNAGLYTLGSMILSMGIFYGGLAQIIAGIMEYKKGNSFGTTAFTSYGLFWLTFVFINLLPNTDFWSEASGPIALGFYLLMWGIFTLFMFFGTLKVNRALQVVFSTLAILFFLLAIGEFTGISLIRTIAGFEGIFCGASAIYLAMAEIINEKYGRPVLPIGSK